MSGHEHYVPILKGKAGEYGAMATLNEAVKYEMTPLIEIPPIPWDWEDDAPAKSVDAHLLKTATNLHKSWGEEEPVFVDLFYIAPDEVMQNGKHPLEHVLDESRAMGVKAIPVTGIDRIAPYQEAVRDAAARDRRGICLRLVGDDFEDLPTLREGVDELCERLGLEREEIDIVVDLGWLSAAQLRPMALAAASMIGNLPHLTAWRTLTLASAAFPENLSGFPAGRVSTTPRTDWDLWRAVVSRQDIERLPAFGDYGIQHPDLREIDPRIMLMSASLRYTVEDEWLIVKGRNVRDYGYEQFNTICTTVTQNPAYRGPDYSWGDSFVAQCADGTAGPGNATVWRKVGTSHHLAVVRDQIASFVGSSMSV